MARSKSINVILNLRDKFTKPVQKTANETKKFQREVKRVENNIKKYTANMAQSFINMTSKITKAAASFSLKAMEKAFNGLKTAGLAAFGALSASFTAGVLEGMDYETYRVQIETATKDTKKAAELMKEAIDLANKTPFEAGQMIEATAKFESMGLSAKKWLSLTADMAGSTSKDIIQAVEAVIDAVASGEFERLKEFGLGKNQLEALDTNGKVFDKKGSVIDQAALTDLLFNEMVKRYEGGAEKLSQTTKGMWSTVTGIFKNSMAKIVGIMDDGTVRCGSILDRVKKYVKKVGDTLLKWQQDGTIDKIAAKFESVLNKVISKIKSFKPIVKSVIDKVRPLFENAIWAIQVAIEKFGPIFSKVMGIAKELVKELVERVVELSEKIRSFVEGGGIRDLIEKLRIIAPIILGIWVAQKLWTLGLQLHEWWCKRAAIAQAALNTVSAIFNGLALANPWGILFTVLIVAIALVIANYEKVCEWCKQFAADCKEAWNTATEWVMNFYNKFAEKFPLLANTVEGVISGIKQQLGGVIDFFAGVFTLNWQRALDGLVSITKGTFEIIKNLVLQPFRLFATGFNTIAGKVNGKFGINIPTIPEFATGTSYHRGGLARVNEGGRGEIINLPNGSQVIPHDISKKAASNTQTINIPITIQGNIYGDHDLVNRVGSMIAQRVTLAIGNV